MHVFPIPDDPDYSDIPLDHTADGRTEHNPNRDEILLTNNYAINERPEIRQIIPDFGIADGLATARFSFDGRE